MQTLIWEKRGVDKQMPLIAIRLKALRERAEMSQMDLAVKAGLSLSLIAGIEQGKKPDPLTSTLQALARALNVSCAALIEDGEPRKPRRTRKQ
jgi:transcriptional regulator with XRE-family HTH domain